MMTYHFKKLYLFTDMSDTVIEEDGKEPEEITIDCVHCGRPFQEFRQVVGWKRRTINKFTERANVHDGVLCLYCDEELGMHIDGAQSRLSSITYLNKSKTQGPDFGGNDPKRKTLSWVVIWVIIISILSWLALIYFPTDRVW